MKSDIEQISDDQAEAAIIATLMYHPEFALHSESLRPNYFYDKFNASIYWAVLQLLENGVTTIDALNLNNAIASNSAVERLVARYNVDLQEYIDMSKFAARHTLEEYRLLVNTVITLAFKRDLNKTTGEIQSACYNPDITLGDLSTLVNNKISRITEQYLITDDVELFGERVDGLWEDLISRQNNGETYGLPSKFPTLNEYFTYEPGELILLTARMKRGKSAFFLNEAVHKLQAGVPTLYIDTEMSDRQFYERMLSCVSGVEVKRIKRGTYDIREEAELKKANEWIKKQPFVHMYMPTTNDDEIYAIHKILKNKMNLEFSIYDYIKSNIASSSEQYNILGAKTDFLKNRISGELNISVLAGAQLNRAGLIGDSDKLSRYSSTVLLWREKTVEELRRDGIDCGNYALTVQLNRNGEQMDDEDYIDMLFNGNQMRITEAKQHAKEGELNPFAVEQNEV